MFSDTTFLNITLAAACGLAGIAIGYVVRIVLARATLSSAETFVKKIISDAHTKAEALKKEKLLEVKESSERDRRELEKEFRDRKHEISSWEKRLDQKEENLERKVDILERKERDLQERDKGLKLKEKKLQDELAAVEKNRDEQRQILERIAGMTAEEAKKILLQNFTDEVKRESALISRSIEQEARETAERKAKEILATAIQKIAADYTSDTTTTTIPIPNDELKGRVIGREGRNIRAFEQATGVDLIVDDTPETITISCFDPVKREIARLSMDKLLADGRIHPARVEEVVNKTKQELENTLKETGEKAAIELGVVGLSTEVMKLLGKLKLRTSYGQNQLQHTMEVAWLSGALAGEMGADINFCKRAALLHDIGKGVDHDMEGTHHQISADLAQKYGESAKMINAILSHHEGLAHPESIEAFILAAADAISASRPGVRRESAEHYIKRLEKLEKAAMGFRGVIQAYAIQAGREIRVLVEPEDIDDSGTYLLAKDIAKKIEKEMEYPGQVKVVVIRETRAQETAK
ncbi:MAG: ribonuclease Y [Elusimicrobia bacterium]|nr:ribonuclease Y [Elusimicrobiota bacterium]